MYQQLDSCDGILTQRYNANEFTSSWTDGLKMASPNFCTKCGNAVAQNGAFCANCGAPTGLSDAAAQPTPTFTSPLSSRPALDPESRKSGTFGKLIVGVLVLVGIIALVCVATSGGAGSANSSTDAADGAITSLVMPVAERQFISIVSSAQSDSRQVENDMQRGGVKANRDNAICHQMPSLLVSNWVGTVAMVDSNSDGKGVFKVSIAPDVSIETWNNELSDMFDHTLMEPGSPVFNAASAMKSGQPIIFSGMFTRGSDGECFGESSLTLQGKVESPDFIFRFSGVQPYSSSAASHLDEEQTSPAQDSAEMTSPAPIAAPQSSALTPNQVPSDATESQERSNSDSQTQNSNPDIDQPSFVGATANQVARRMVNIPADTAVGMLVSKVQPDYPPIAEAARVSGTVVLRVTISKAGEIENLQVVSGPAMLQEAAIDAVKQWRYRPYLVNDEPIEVETTINVTFALGP